MWTKQASELLRTLWGHYFFQTACYSHCKCSHLLRLSASLQRWHLHLPEWPLCPQLQHNKMLTDFTFSYQLDPQNVAGGRKKKKWITFWVIIVKTYNGKLQTISHTKSNIQTWNLMKKNSKRQNVSFPQYNLVLCARRLQIWLLSNPTFTKTNWSHKMKQDSFERFPVR